MLMVFVSECLMYALASHMFETYSEYNRLFVRHMLMWPV